MLNNHARMAGSRRGVLTSIRELFCVGAEPAVAAVESGPSPTLADASFRFLTEKSVSTGGSLDKRYRGDHTVVYLIRYAIL